MQAVDYSREDLHRYLKGCAWPCSPTIVVQIARASGAPTVLLEHLQALPNRIYMAEREIVDELARAGAFQPAEGTAMMASDPRVQVGMTVVGSDLKEVGRVKEVRASDFLLDRRLQRDLYVPFEAIEDVTAGGVVLNLPAKDIHYKGWLSPPLIGGPSRARA
jgi:hypothetical protein